MSNKIERKSKFKPSFLYHNTECEIFCKKKKKKDKLEALMMIQLNYLQCDLMCLTEMWLQDRGSGSSVSMSTFQMIQADRDLARSWQSKGRGIAVLVNSR